MKDDKTSKSPFPEMNEEDKVTYDGRLPAFPAGRFFHGMSLRDYFAAQVVGQLLQTQTFNAAAERAYQIADAMIAERNKGKE